MRDTEFRGKSIDTGELVYGDLVHDITGHPMIEVRAGSHDGEDILVDPETVGEYTGLKDKNGVKIFEGDIVKIDNDIPEETIIGCVVDEYASWQIDYGADLTSLYQQLIDLKEYQTVEILGNIHDTPQLLKGE